MFFISLAWHCIFSQKYTQSPSQFITDTIPLLGIFKTNSHNTKIDRCEVIKFSFIKTNIKGLKVISYAFDCEGPGICFNTIIQNSDKVTADIKKKIANIHINHIHIYDIIVEDTKGKRYKLPKTIFLSLKGNRECV